MVPARNLLRRHYDSYGGGCFDVDDHYGGKPSNPLRSNLMMMAETQEEEEEEEEESEQQEEQVGTSGGGGISPADDSWLQLGIGVLPSSSSSSSSAAAPGPSVELQLFSDKSSSSRPVMTSSRPPPWGFWSSNLMNVGASSSRSSTCSMPQQSQTMMMPQFYNVERFPAPPAVDGGPRFGELRVVSPPARRQAAGVWFLLKAAENQVREPFLPQLPKSYIRIKDSRMTVRLLMKYLVRKLGMDDETEVQISCRGRLLPPSITLQHVRDQIWCQSEADAFLPDSPSIEHVMTLRYGRSP